MKALAAAGLILVTLSAGAASASSHQGASLRALKLTPPTFRGSGFQSHEQVTLAVQGVSASSVRVTTDSAGRFRVRLAALPSCKAWKVRAVGAKGEAAVYRHARCASLTTDVQGVVRRGPTKNTCVVGEPCSAPAPGVSVQAFRAGILVAKTTTDGNGRFSFALAAGDYTIQALGRGTEPKTVHVETSAPVQVAFMIDTGIR